MVDTGNQAFDIVILTGDMMSASHVEPVHFKKPLAEFFLPLARSVVSRSSGILFAEGMKNEDRPQDRPVRSVKSQARMPMREPGAQGS